MGRSTSLDCYASRIDDTKKIKHEGRRQYVPLRLAAVVVCVLCVLCCALCGLRCMLHAACCVLCAVCCVEWCHGGLDRSPHERRLPLFATSSQCILLIMVYEVIMVTHGCLITVKRAIAEKPHKCQHDVGYTALLTCVVLQNQQHTSHMLSHLLNLTRLLNAISPWRFKSTHVCREHFFATQASYRACQASPPCPILLIAPTHSPVSSPLTAEPWTVPL